MVDIPHEDAKGQTVTDAGYHFPTDYAYENWPSDDEGREWRLTGLALAALVGALVGFAVGVVL